MGRTAAMTVVAKAEFAQSYMAQARSSFRCRPRARRSSRLGVGGDEGPDMAVKSSSPLTVEVSGSYGTRIAGKLEGGGVFRIRLFPRA